MRSLRLHGAVYSCFRAEAQSTECRATPHDTPLPTPYVTLNPNHEQESRPLTRPDAQTPPLLRVYGLTKAYATPQGPLPVLRGIDLALDAGETLALMGESGSGKSTLLHLVGALDDADTGEIRLDGVDIARLPESAKAAVRREIIGVVFQQFNLIASLTVRENLAFQARLANRLDPDWLARLTQRLGLAGLVERYPEQLSGGQQQRVAIGRALAARPRLLLADEPTGNLDEPTGDAALALTLELVAETGCGFLMVTHSARLAARLQRQATLEAGALVSG
jgi:putative ABC transport system ATP-binding protein